MVINLDNNATTQPHLAVVRAMQQALEVQWHNPSSVHRGGQDARREVERARAATARLLGCGAKSIVFTSGGTESLDTVIRSALMAKVQAARGGEGGEGERGGGGGAKVNIVTTATEHSAVRELCAELAKPDSSPGIELRLAPVGLDGVVDERALFELVDDSTAVVCLQWANNETGTVQAVGRIGDELRRRGVKFCCDATQWAGKMPMRLARIVRASASLTNEQTGEAAAEAVSGPTPDPWPSDWCDADYVIFAPHKFHGPKGVGVLYIRPGAGLVPRQLGSQELGRRGGTENVPGIVGCGVACDLAISWLIDERARLRQGKLRDRFEAEVCAALPGTVVNGVGGKLGSDPARRLWNTSNLGFAGLEAEAILLGLSEKGVYASAGAACSSGSLDPSPVLLAMGIAEPVAHGSIRFSLSRETTEREVVEAARVVAGVVRRIGGG